MEIIQIDDPRIPEWIRKDMEAAGQTEIFAEMLADVISGGPGSNAWFSQFDRASEP